MANKMLIDASHPEETRVVVLRGNRVEDFDFESANKKQLRGNIYLAKVTRVEPSLQAAFVDYGGNRHGFLAFSEIHPDYYQIPVADRLALLEDEARAHEEEEQEERPRRSRRRRERGRRRYNRDERVTSDAGLDTRSTPLTAPPEMFPFYYAPVDDAVRLMEPAAPAPKAEPVIAVAPAREEEEPREEELIAREDQSDEQPDIDTLPSNVEEIIEREDDDEDEESEEETEQVEQLGGDALEEMPMRAPRMRRQYKIQEVIKRRQVLLVQVVKEERGNKGAALTTYLSLAGRYSVLMPNTARGGGISRKITDAGDRRRLKELVQDLEVPEGMGVILRTAGASRTRPEIKRDFEYLLRMWETVRELTLKSTAPNLVYEEGSLIKRSIRDLYNKEIDDVIVAGDEGYREARDFMRLLMPSHVRSVQQWSEPQPVFARFGVEQQLDAMFSNVVTLKSGGYIVINQTEALVAIDVNSGRSTREHNIEDTALRTNLEAADEVARQLRLRDLAGLIVVDFIDMEENRNNRAVERRIKDALKNDRARIQVGRISHFGLLEMSRQRMRTGVLEGSTVQCPHCMGSGSVRSTASIALHILRVMEDTLIKNAQYNLIVRARSEVALYILNQKRAHVSELEARFGVSITVLGDDTLTGNVHHALERGELATPPIDLRRQSLVRIDSVIPDDLEEEIEEIEEEEEAEERAEADGSEAEGEDGEGRRRRRRRRRRGGRGDRDASYVSPDAPQPPDTGLLMMAEIAGDIPNRLSEASVSDGDVDENEAEGFEAEGNGEDGERRRRRRSRRGGRNRRRERDGEPLPLDAEQPASFTDEYDPAPRVEQSVVDLSAPPFAQPHIHVPEPIEAPRATAAPVIEPPVVEAPPAPAPAPISPPAAASAPEPAAASTPEPVPAREAPLPEASVDPSRPKRTGWWAKAKQTLGGG
jgi:ribonuclease E